MPPNAQEPVAPPDANQPPANPADPAVPAPAAPANPDPAATPPADPARGNPKLQSERDKALNRADDAETRLSQLEAWAGPIAQERSVTDFLKTNATKFPDLEASDLMHVESPAELEAEATRIQTRLQQHAQKKLMDIENHRLPTLTVEERNQQLETLKKDKPKDGLAQAIALKLAAPRR